MRLSRTWVLLVGMSGLTAGLAAVAPARVVLVLGALLLSGAKARLILGNFLALHSAPNWQKGFDLALGFLLATFAVLALAV